MPLRCRAHGTLLKNSGKKSRSEILYSGQFLLKMKGFKRLMQSTPKLRGFNSLNAKPTEVRTGDLEKKYNEGEVVNLKTLKEKDLLSKQIKEAKIILKGELKKKLIVEGLKMTKGAKEMIEKIGGTIK